MELLSTLKKMIQPDEPAQTNELAQKRAALDTRKSLLASRVAESNRLAAATLQATAARSRAHSALAAIITDPMRYATASDAEMAAAKQTLVSAVDVEAKAIAGETAYRADVGDLKAESIAIARDERLLLADELRAAYRDAAADYLPHLAATAAAEVKLAAIHERALALFTGDDLQIPRGAGIVPLTAPKGVFRPDVAPDGSKRSLFRHIVFKAGLFAADLLPADLADEVVDEIQKWRQGKEKGIVLLPRPQGWFIVGDFRNNPVDEKGEQDLFRGSVGLESLGHFKPSL